MGSLSRGCAVLGLLVTVVAGCGEGKKAPPKRQDQFEGIQVTGQVEGHETGVAAVAINFVPLDDAGNEKAGQAVPGGSVEGDGTFKFQVPAGKYRIYLIGATGGRTPAQVVTVSEQSKQFVVKAEASEDQ